MRAALVTPLLAGLCLAAGCAGRAEVVRFDRASSEVVEGPLRGLRADEVLRPLQRRLEDAGFDVVRAGVDGLDIARSDTLARGRYLIVGPREAEVGGVGLETEFIPDEPARTIEGRLTANVRLDLDGRDRVRGVRHALRLMPRAAAGLPVAGTEQSLEERFWLVYRGFIAEAARLPGDGSPAAGTPAGGGV